MEQVTILKDAISNAIEDNTSSDPIIIENMLSYKTKLEEWQIKLTNYHSSSDKGYYPRTMIEPLFDLIEEIKNDLPANVLASPAETEWGGVVATYYTMCGWPYTLPRGPRGWGKCMQTFSVRNINYLSDRVKVPSLSPLFNIRCIQMFGVHQLGIHLAEKNWFALPSNRHGNEYFIMNLMVPGTPPIHVVLIYVASPDALAVLSSPLIDSMINQTVNIDSPKTRTKLRTQSSVDSSIGKTTSMRPDCPITEKGWAHALRRFWRADKEYCDNRFKMIPSVVEGPWAIRMAVGSKPALTGLKLQQYYFRGDGYFEVDIDLRTSTFAANLLGMVRDMSRALTLDMAITIQGNEQDELPERILCQSRFLGVEFGSAPMLQENDDFKRTTTSNTTTSTTSS